MVKLLFDIGNSACKCAEYSGDINDLVAYPPVGFQANDIGACVPTSDAGFASITVASVRSAALNRRLSRILQENFGKQPIFITARRAACGVTIAYPRPGRLGADRFAALLGAWQQCGGACIVVDCGTAVTIDAIDGSGVHQGGVIMPGLRLLGKALGQGTARLPDLGAVEGAAARNLFACDTVSAMAAGCQKMFSSAVLAAVQEMRSRLAAPATLFVTGGDAERLPVPADANTRYRPHLVLEGLAVFSDYLDDCG